MIDFTLFRNPVFSSAVATALFAAAALLGMELVFSQRLQLVQGMSPMQAALYILPLSLAAFVAGPLASWMLPRVGSRRMLISSLLVSGAGMGGYLLSYDAALIPQIASLCVLGAGIGAAMTAASGTIMQSAPVERAGMAASVEEVSYELGGALGVTLMGSILSGVYAQSLDVPVGVAASPARDSLDEALIVADQLSAELGGALAQLARTAFDAGYAAVLASCTAMLLGAAVVVLLKAAAARPDGKPAPGHGPGSCQSNHAPRPAAPGPARRRRGYWRPSTPGSRRPPPVPAPARRRRSRRKRPPAPGLPGKWRKAPEPAVHWRRSAPCAGAYATATDARPCRPTRSRWLRSTRSAQ